MFELYNEDCIDWLHMIEDESVDLVVTDPAYESLEKHRAVGTTTRLTKDWFPIFRNERFVELLTELYRVLKKNTHCYIYCDQETMHMLHHLIVVEKNKLFPFKWWKFLIFDKVTIGMGYHYRAQHECIVFLEKGKRRLNNLGTADIISAPRVRGAYPTEKPVSVSKILIEQSSLPGELIIDPFLGSGSTGDAALSSGRLFAGCDIVQKALNTASVRLQQYTEGPVLRLRQ